MTREAFELMADVLPEPMLLVTVTGKIIAANKSMRQMLGTGFAQGLQSDISEIFRIPREQTTEYLKLCSGVRKFLPGSLDLHFCSDTDLDLRCEGVGIDSPGCAEQLILLRLKAKLAAVGRFQMLNGRLSY